MVTTAPPKKAITWLALAWSSEKAVCASMVSPLQPKYARNAFMPSSDNRKRRFRAATASIILAATIFHNPLPGLRYVFEIDELADGTFNRLLQQMVLTWSPWP
jgi:hypothetical protein